MDAHSSNPFVQPHHGRAGNPGLLWRLALPLAALALLAGLTALAFTQQSDPHPDRSGFLGVAWWLYPCERNAFREQPVLTAHLYGIDFRPGTKEVWVVGSGGLVAVSNNEGQTWKIKTIGSSLPTSRIVTPSTTRPADATQSRATLFSPMSLLTGLLEEAPARSDRGNVEQRPPAINKESPSTPREEDLSPKNPVASPEANVRRPEEKTGATTAPSSPSGTSGAGVNTPATQSVPIPTTQPNRDPLRCALHAIAFADANVGWAVGAGGAALVTHDGGANWERAASGTSNDLYALAYAQSSAPDVLAVGDQTISALRALAPGDTLATPLYGTSSKFTMPAALRSAVFTESGDLFAGSTSGVVFAVQNNRYNPAVQRRATDLGEAIFGIAAVSGSVWVCGDEQFISTSTDGFITRREEHRDPLGGALHAIVVTSPGKGLAVGDNGAMLKYEADGKWTRKPTVVTTRLNAARFADANNGWIVGDYGTVLHTIDGGVNWQRVTGDWLPVAPIVTTQPSVVHPSTQPAGIDRARLSSYRPMWMPAPWYFASVLALLGLVTMGMRRPPQSVDAKLPDNYVPAAEQAASDKPLQRGEPDPLQFGAVAAGLSRFLRNENTLPPLTLAITGVWGSGKSSLMNLLKSDLERFDVRPVWFNAWHHQHDERPLASLLEAIKQQGVPPFWSGAGMRFRASLLWQRSKRWRPVILAAAIFCAWMLGYYMRNQHEFSRIVSGVTDTISSFLDFIQGKQAAKAPPADGGITGDGTLAQVGFLAFLGTDLALGRSLFGALRAFGADPARLMQSVSDRARIQDLHAKADFRPRFVREFNDVTTALGERSMIIFIDDLDRCESPQVLEMLESVNFLVTSGDCFVVLGMDVKIVTPSVALQFRDLASEVAAEDEDPADPALADFRRRAFARNYLDKLVQIEVSVPMTDPARSVRVIAPEKDEQKKDLPYYWRTGWTVGWRVLPLLLCGLAIYCAALYGARVEAPAREPNPRSQALAPVRPTSNPSSTTQAAETAPVVAAQPIFVATTQPTPHLVPPERPRNAFWIVAVPAGAIIAALLWIILTRPQATVPDSETFKNAVKLWHPILFGRGATPRSMKRFMNRVRFLAMKQQPGGEELTPRERLAAWFKNILGLTEPKTKSDTSSVTPVDADLLVSWAGIERVLGRDRDFKSMPLETVCTALKLPATDPLSKWLTKKKWSAMVACYENYRVLSQGASIH